jgi:hypothetical protein
MYYVLAMRNPTISEYFRALAKKKARKMTRAQRREHALKMNEARWGKAKGDK